MPSFFICLFVCLVWFILMDPHEELDLGSWEDVTSEWPGAELLAIPKLFYPSLYSIGPYK